jgi:hypothetical protein
MPMQTSGLPLVKGFYDRRTFSIQYVVACPKTKRCAITSILSSTSMKGQALSQRGMPPQSFSVACRSFLCRSILQGPDRRADCDRRPRGRCSGSMEENLQLARIPQ